MDKYGFHKLKVYNNIISDVSRSRVGVAVTDGKLYAFGGFNGQERLSTVRDFIHINTYIFIY